MASTWTWRECANVLIATWAARATGNTGRNSRARTTCRARRGRASREGVAMISGAYQYPELEKVIYGRPFAQALADEVAAMGANAVFLLAGGSLSRDTNWVSDIRT